MTALRCLVAVGCALTVTVGCAQVSPTQPVSLDHSAYNAAQKLAGGPVGTLYSSQVTPRDQPFPDVLPGHWAFDAVEMLRQRGILIGYPAGTLSAADRFQPPDPAPVAEP